MLPKFCAARSLPLMLAIRSWPFFEAHVGLQVGIEINLLKNIALVSPLGLLHCQSFGPAHRYSWAKLKMDCHSFAMWEIPT